jgi:hypothetical protein
MDANIKQKDLKDMSNKELDALYASLSRGCGNGEPNSEMIEIEKIMSARYEEYSSQSSK